MSKSLHLVKTAADRLGISLNIIQTPSGTHTAQMAADFIGCDLSQIAKSVIMRQEDELVMFITSGSKRVSTHKAKHLAGDLQKADAAAIREVTGFAIGGVSPIGSLHPIQTYFDQNLLEFEVIYAAAGTPHALFAIKPSLLLQISQAQIGDFVE